ANRPSTIGGGDWSANDLLGHLQTWEEVAIDAYQSWLGGSVSADAQQVTDETSLDAFNKRKVAEKSGRPWSEALSSFRETNATLVQIIRTLSDEEWAAPATRVDGSVSTLSNVLGGATGGPDGPFSHTLAHLGDLQKLTELA
ncbi:MAG: maleylpyruvate isomerase N-terminal domain-containing protein, partial [Actinobacteria bacterium]|nr:maleylpyruvate isomerase N-terminal domain-containing protein [Actinomycetota bacterium]